MNRILKAKEWKLANNTQKAHQRDSLLAYRHGMSAFHAMVVIRRIIFTDK